MSDLHQPFTLTPETRASLANDFIWGVATSAYQIEGGAAEGGRGPSIWDTFSHTPGKTARGDTGDVACDHYHRWRDDVALMAGLGVDAYRFSISWSRVQPLGHGDWNEQGLGFYDRLVDALLAKGIRPHATLYHWDLPQGLQDRGGWAARETALRFADYAERIALRLGDRLAGIATHNEPWCTATLGNERGQFAPGFQDAALAADVSHHLLVSHGLALQAMRATGTRTPLGIVLNQSSTTAADDDSSADRALAATEYAKFVRWYMDPIFEGRYPLDPGIAHYPRNVQAEDFAIIGQPLDFLGINYYTRIWASAATPPLPAPRALGVTDMGWEIYPEGLTELLVGLHERYPGLPPIYLMENGMANADEVVDGRIADAARIDYMRRHLEALARAREAGVDIRGFFYWSLLDNYEWDSGYGKRFGLVHVDYETQRRTLKDSAMWYRETLAALRRRETAHG